MKCLQFGSWFCVIWTLQMRNTVFTLLFRSFVARIFAHILFDDPVALHLLFFFASLDNSFLSRNFNSNALWIFFFNLRVLYLLSKMVRMIQVGTIGWCAYCNVFFFLLATIQLTFNMFVFHVQCFWCCDFFLLLLMASF